MSKLTNDLQQAAKFSRDVDAIASGSPRRMANRAKNRVIGRALAKTGFWRWLWKGLF